MVLGYHFENLKSYYHIIQINLKRLLIPTYNLNYILLFSI